MIAASQHSITGVRIGSMEVSMPRYILAEFNTHRLFSRNSASSRAIPFRRMVKSVKDNPFIPLAWQEDHKGMQGTHYFTGRKVKILRTLWLFARTLAVWIASLLHWFKLTKQLANRILEPFMWHVVLVTATEYDNFFELRCPQYAMSDISTIFHKSKKDVITKKGPLFALFSDLDWLNMNKGKADIHMMALAEAMWDCYHQADFKILQPGEWHMPYADQIDPETLISVYEKEFGEVLSTGNLVHFLTKVVSIARCARLSYKTLSTNPKIDYISDIKLFDTLKSSGHLSPFEHVARAMTEIEIEQFVKTIVINEEPVQQKGWCANFNSFIQYRSLIKNAA